MGKTPVKSKRKRLKIITSIEATAVDRAILELLESKPERTFNGRRCTFLTEVERLGGNKRPFNFTRAVNYRIERLSTQGKIAIDRGPTNDPQAAGLQAHVVTSVALTEDGHAHLEALRSGSIVFTTPFADLDDEQREEAVLALIRDWFGEKPPEVRSIAAAFEKRDSTPAPMHGLYAATRALVKRKKLRRTSRTTFALVIEAVASETNGTDTGEAVRSETAPPAAAPATVASQKRREIMSREDVQTLLRQCEHELGIVNIRREQLEAKKGRLQQMLDQYYEHLKRIEPLLVCENEEGGA